MTLKIQQLAVIENAWRDGLTIYDAARAVGVSPTTAFYKFRALRNEGVPRGEVRRRTPARQPYSVPFYDGPAWIGRAC